jgi:tetratricopeptide (TPR) repeat protein
MSEETKPKKSLFKDPVATFLVVLIGLVIIGALLTLIFSIMNGVTAIDDAPRSYEDYTVIAEKKELAESDDQGKAQAWANYIIALATNGQVGEAKAQLAEAQAANLDVERTQALKYAEARLFEIEGNPDQAVALYEELSKELLDAYTAEEKKGGDGNWALAFGIPLNYTESQLRLAGISMEKKDWSAAIGYLDTYLKENPTDAGVLIDRGNAKLDEGDKKGAVKDFDKALKFLPNDEEALAGKKKAEE